MATRKNDSRSIRQHPEGRIDSKRLGCPETDRHCVCSGGRPGRFWVSCRIIFWSEASGNIIKNVKGVIVPTTGNLRGIEAAAILGAVGGDPSKKLEVLTAVTPEHIEQTRELLALGICQSELLQTQAKLHLIVAASQGEDSALIEIMHGHTNIVRIEKNGKVLLHVPQSLTELEKSQVDRGCLNVDAIIAFADSVDIAEVKDVLELQIKYNTAIADEGLSRHYGANVGKTLLFYYGSDVKVRAKARAAAGSDARMSGCEMPVVINSGSGNQGMTVSLPVIEYARELGVSHDRLLRALCISNLIAIHQKTKIGKLSAYCGAVSAATGAGAAITYLYGGGVSEISQTITNTLANVAGIVCDGAKPSCAAKIASSVDAATMAFCMTMQSRVFMPGEGIVKNGIEETIDSVSRMAREGMRETDAEILRIMVEA